MFAIWLAVGRELVAPDEAGAVAAEARCPLPLGLGREPLAGPRRVGLGVLPCDVDDGMLVHRPSRSLVRPLGVTP